MKPDLAFEFSADKKNNTITVTREFAAPLKRVWPAWTESDLLDQWWAPKPYQTKTKSLDFTVGGSWLYAMMGPDNFEQWCRADYKSIDAEKSFSAQDGFCDSNGNLIPDFPRSLWTNTFAEKGDRTLVTIFIKYDKLEDLEKIIEMGFQEGFTMGLQNLDALLAKS